MSKLDKGFATDDRPRRISWRGFWMRDAGRTEPGRFARTQPLISRRAILVGDRERETWYVGETIVCVDNGFLDLAAAPELVEGALYTIAAIWPKRRGHYGLELREQDAKAIYIAFDERRFRPLAES